ncbi:MAG: hypothetical protein P8P27_09250 [Flavobacteriaceae bacterium]|nr:hypothetical protein [Flavobacteriaceae bacterium]
MKKFIKQFIYYGLITTIVLGLLSITVDNGLKKINDNMFGDWNRLFNNEINDDIIIIGNSRAKVHFNPVIIEDITGYSSYNLGKDAINLFLQQPIINSVLIHVKPKYMVLSLDIGSFQNKQEIFEKEQYLPFLNKPYIYPILSQLDNKVNIERLIPMFKYRGQFSIIKKGIKSYISPDNSYSLNKGFYGSDKEFNSDFDNFKKLMGDTKIILNNYEIENGLKLLEDIILKCKQNRVELILCQAPKLKELYPYFPQKEKVDDQIAKLAKQYNVLYTDFSYDELHENRDMFYNASHLNATGANTLTKNFAELFISKFGVK